MRKTWIAIAVIALAVGVGVGYRLGRPGKPDQGLRPADRPTEVLPQRSAAKDEGPAPRHVAPSVQETPLEKDRGRATVDGDEALSPNPSEHERSRGSREVELSPVAPATPAVIAGGPPLSFPPGHGDVGAPPVAPPTPSTPATTTPAAAQEQDKETTKSAAVDDPESDRRPPTLQFLRFDPAETKGGGTATLTVGSVDDLSGIKLVYGSVRSPSGSAAVPFSARDATGSGEFAATITVPAQAETGDWYVANLQIVDKADNALALAFARATVPVGGTLRVVSEDSDSTAPTVHRVSLARGVVDAGEKNQIIVDVDDDRSGVALVTGAFQSPSKAAFIPFTCLPNGESSWEGDVPVPANADCGEWTLRQLRVVDKANNSAFLAIDAPEIGHVGFVVSGSGQCDSDPPVLDGLSFAPAVVSNAEAATLVVTVTAHDDASGVASVSGWIDGPVATNGQAPRIYFSCIADPREPEAPMTARITVAQFAAKGVWRVSVAQVSDKARNTRSYNMNDPALRDASFNVE